MAEPQRNAERLTLFQEVARALPDNTARQNFTRYRNLSERHINTVHGELRAFQQLPLPPVRPQTADSTVGHRLEYVLDNATLPTNPHDFDRIPLTLARSTCQQHRNTGTRLPLGCWISPNVPSHSNGYVKINFRNTMVGGAQLGCQIYLHQLALIADNREGELKAATDPDRDMQVSHLCHEGRCFNPAHLVVEDANMNKERNTCQGHYIIRHGGMSWHPCAHARDGVRKRCILAEKFLPDGWHSNSD
jgi:hypothetical protein